MVAALRIVLVLCFSHFLSGFVAAAIGCGECNGGFERQCAGRRACRRDGDIGG